MFNANEDMFLQAFNSTPKLNLTTQKGIDNELSRVISIIGNPNAEWDSRVQAIKQFRSLVKSGIADAADFHTTTLKSLEIPFQNNICDLRSQVVRETCITIAFLSDKLQQKFSRMAEVLLPALIKLIPNSAKIVSTSAFVALRFIIQSTHNSRFIPIIKYQLSTSKSKDIHRALCEITERIITKWQPNIVERHLTDFLEVLRLGICNSDEMARQSARRAFNVFAEHFREPADRLFNSLDPQRQRMLNNLNHGGGSTLSMNGYGSSTTINLSNVGHTASSSSTMQNSHGRANSVHGPSSLNMVSRLKNSLTSTTSNGTSGNLSTNSTNSNQSRVRTPTARSTSAIDVAAQRRARARAVYLSSMYSRPRQMGVVPVTSSPSKSNVLANNCSIQPSSLSIISQTIPSPTTIPSSHNQQQQLSHHIHNQYNQQTMYMHSSRTHQTSPGYTHNPPQNYHSHTSHQSSNPSTPNVAQQQQQLQQLQQQQAASAEKRDGMALSKAASYLVSVMNNNSIGESQIVTTIKYFNSLIEKHPPEIVSQFLPELMPPLVIGIENTAICVRKASVFAMVAIHTKTGLKQMEPYLTSLTMAQRKLLEVYIRKFKEENKPKQPGDHDDTRGSSSHQISSTSTNIVGH